MYRHIVIGESVYIDGWFLHTGDEYWLDDDGKFHREDGPAIIRSGDRGKFWYKHGVLHREDGPAIIHSIIGEEWWVNGFRQQTPD